MSRIVSSRRNLNKEETQTKTAALHPPLPVKSKRKKNVDQEYARFVEIMRSMTLNNSAYDLCMVSSKYAKFFKTMLSTKKEPRTDDLVTISARCSSLLKKDIQLP